MKKIAAKLPERLQTEAKRLHFARQIVNDTFVTDEPEYNMLETLVRPGDWVIDVGANVGHYTKKLSALAGEQGRVIAFEPMPTTFSILAANVQRFRHSNVTLFNAAVSDGLDVVGMSVPKFDSGLDNFYMAEIAPSERSRLSVLTMSLDALRIEHNVSLVKIDAEGHEEFVLAGMSRLIADHRPTLIVETDSLRILEDLKSKGYGHERLEGSPNILFTPQ